MSKNDEPTSKDNKSLMKEMHLSENEKISYIFSYINDFKEKYQLWWKTLSTGMWAIILTVPLTIILEKDIEKSVLSSIQLLLIIYLPIFFFLITYIFIRIQHIDILKKHLMIRYSISNKIKKTIKLEEEFSLLSTATSLSRKPLYTYFMNSKGEISYRRILFFPVSLLLALRSNFLISNLLFYVILPGILFILSNFVFPQISDLFFNIYIVGVIFIPINLLLIYLKLNLSARVFSKHGLNLNKLAGFMDTLRIIEEELGYMSKNPEKFDKNKVENATNFCNLKIEKLTKLFDKDYKISIEQGEKYIQKMKDIIIEINPSIEKKFPQTVELNLI